MARSEIKIVALTVGLICVLVSLSLPKGERFKAVAFFAAWLLPGAGHVLVGKWKKGLFFFLLLGATYAFGMWVAGFRPVSFEDNPFYFIGQYGSGATWMIARLRGAEKAILRPGIHPSWFDPGLLYVCVVGLLNLVIMLNVLDTKALAAVGPAPARPVPPPGEPSAKPAPVPGAPPAQEKAP